MDKESVHTLVINSKGTDVRSISNYHYLCYYYYSSSSSVKTPKEGYTVRDNIHEKLMSYITYITE